MRVALVSPGGFDPSGQERVIPALLALTERLAARHGVHVFVPGPGVPYRLADAVVHPLGGRRFQTLPAALESEGPFDVVQAFWVDAGLHAARAARHRGIPCALHLGGGELVSIAEIGFGGARGLRGRARNALAIRLADAVSAGSRAAAAALPPGINARLIPLGIDVARFDSDETRESGPPWRLLHVASLNAVKDQKTLLEAVRLASVEVDVRLDIAGEDTLGGQIERLAISLGLSPRVTFHGFLPNERLVSLYRAAHLHVVSSRYESQSVVVSEAAAASLPTVGTAVGILPELAPDAAVCVAVGDPAALARAIVTLLHDDGRRLSIARAARRWVGAHDASATAAAFESLWAEMLGQKRGGSIL